MSTLFAYTYNNFMFCSVEERNHDSTSVYGCTNVHKHTNFLPGLNAQFCLVFVFVFIIFTENRVWSNMCKRQVQLQHALSGSGYIPVVSNIIKYRSQTT